MNNSVIAALICAVFIVFKLGLKYKNPDVKAAVQDGVLVYISSIVGLYGMEYYGAKPVIAKVAAVFTEKPNF